MVKFLFVGDWHLRGTNPRNRIDDYKETAKQKLKEVFKIAVDHGVDAILQPGDIFDRPEVGIAVLLEYAEVLKECPVDIYCTLGNHDIYGYNVDSYYRTSLRLLEMLVLVLEYHSFTLLKAPAKSLCTWRKVITKCILPLRHTVRIWI